MNVYGHRSYTLNVPAFLRRFHSGIEALPAEPAHEAIVDCLVDFGEFHAAMADAGALTGGADAVLRAISDALCASHRGDRRELRRAVARMRPCVAALAAAPPLDRDVDAKPSEGFALFALYPAQYIVAAERFIRQRTPPALTCVGIRGIGAPLAFVVAAAANAMGVRTEVFTVRPTGHPFDRRLDLPETIRRALASAPDGSVAIVDEGPGLSGSSFAAVSDALLEIGVAADRIVLFPSWSAPETALRSPRGRAAWRRHAKAIAAFEDVWPLDAAVDLSGGRWRAHVFGLDESHWPAVQPQHERRKYLGSPAGPHHGVLWKFAGLGRYGRAKLARAQLLSDAGFTAAPIHLRGGFLVETWIDGERLDSSAAARGDVVERVAEYLAFLRTHCQTGRRAMTEDIEIACDFDEPEIAVDGRLLPHEWIDAQKALLKSDALDHHADDFLPGCRDIAWDLAGAVVEFDLDAPAERHLFACYQRLSGDRTIARRAPFYRRAYLTYRAAYATLAADALGDTPDGRRFRAAATRYRRSLAARAPLRPSGRRC